MAKIQRLQREQSFNKPIGVVTPSNAGVQAGLEMERLGAQMFERYYEKAVGEEKVKGQEFADSFVVRDEKQNISFRSLPKSLSKVARLEAQPLIDKKYRNALLSDMKAQAERIRADHPNDPDGFDKSYTEYIKNTHDLTDERHRAFVLDAGATLAGENASALYADKVNAEDAAAYKEEYNLIVADAQDLAALVEGGKTSLAQAGNDFTKINRRIDELVAEHGDRMSVTAAIELKKSVKRQYGGALLGAVSQNVIKMPEFQDPMGGSNRAADVLNSLEMAYRMGSAEGISQRNMEILKKAGFSEGMLSPEFLDAESRRIIAGDLSVLENNYQEQLTATIKERQAFATASDLAAGNMVSKESADNLLSVYGYNTAEDVLNDLPNILSGKTAKHKEIMGIVLHNNSDLPTVFKNIFSSDNLQKLANEGQLPLALDLYQQSTKRLNSDGSGVNTVQRGLSEDTMVEMNALIAYRNGVKQASFEDYFQRRNELAMNPNRQNMLNHHLGMKNDKQVTISDFVANSVGSDATIEEIDFYKQYAGDLVLMHGKERAAEILKESAGRVFVKSNFIHGKARSRFAPEKAFPDRTEQAVFKASVELQLERAGGNYKLGENAFLVPDARHGSVNPVYLLVDKDKMPIMDGSKPLMVSGRAVIDARAKRTNKTKEETLAEMRKEYQRRLQYEAGTSGVLKDPSMQGEVTEFFKNNMGAKK